MGTLDDLPFLSILPLNPTDRSYPVDKSFVGVLLGLEESPDRSYILREEGGNPGGQRREVLYSF